MLLGRKEVSPQMEVKMNGDILDVVSSSKYLGSCFSKDVGSLKDVEMRVGTLVH